MEPSMVISPTLNPKPSVPIKKSNLTVEKPKKVEKKHISLIKEKSNRRASCVDTSIHCKIWARTDQCTINWRWMHDYCKKSCHLCTRHNMADTMAGIQELLQDQRYDMADIRNKLSNINSQA